MVHASSMYVRADRPWMELYGKRVPQAVVGVGNSRQTPVATDGASGEEETEDTLSLIQRLLSDDIMVHVIRMVPAHSMARAACVCKSWHRVTERPALWEKACRDVFPSVNGEEEAEEETAILEKQFSGCWRTMYLNRPHLRFDGMYISRNTYLRVGEQGFRVKNPVHLVLYFRFMRFFPNGTLIYRTSPQFPIAVMPTMMNYQRYLTGKFNHDGINISHGRYLLEPSGKLCTSVLYPGDKSTEVRCRLQLRSTTAGANNRLDVRQLVLYDREVGRFTPQPGALAGDESEADENIPGRKECNRGLNTYVFVPWEDIPKHELNLTLDEMDYYVPG